MKRANIAININTLVTTIAVALLVWVGKTLNEVQRDLAVVVQRVVTLEQRIK